MKTIVKMTGIGLLGLCALTACQEDNPMFKPQMSHDLGVYLNSHSTLEDQVTCVKYAADTKKYPSEKNYCTKWLYDKYEEYTALTKVEMAMYKQEGIKNHKEMGQPYDKAIPTYDQFMDPAVWKLVWKNNGKEWQEEYDERKRQEAIEAEKERKRKAYCKKHKNEFSCIRYNF